MWDDQFVVDPFQAGAGTSHHMNVNEVIANRATLLLGGSLGEYRVHPNDDVNMSQSTNDVIPTAIRLGCLWRLGELLAGTGGPGGRPDQARQPSLMTLSNPGAPTCRTRYPSAWGRNLGRMPGRWSATQSASSGQRRDCAGWGSAAPRPGRV